MQNYLALPPKSYQSIFSGTTNKIIKETLKKEEFFT